METLTATDLIRLLAEHIALSGKDPVVIQYQENRAVIRCWYDEELATIFIGTE